MFHSGSIFEPCTKAALFLAIFAFGCPQTSPDALRIERIDVEGDERADDFDLMVTGGGFIRAVAFDLAQKQGSVITSNLAVEVRGNGGFKARMDFNVLSGTTMRVQVRGGPLPPEIYELVLFLDEKEQTSALLFDLTNVDPNRDGGVRRDAGVGPGPDGGEDDGGVVRDGGPGRDAGFRDGGPPDSGLGDFEGAFGYRRHIDITTGVEAPANVTLRIPVQHEQLVTLMKSRADGRDLAVYQGKDRLEHQFDDRVLLATDALVLIVRLLRAIEVTGPPDGDALTLYYGDPAAMIEPSDTVFEFVERFTQDISPINGGNDNAWNRNDWDQCRNGRPSQMVVDPPESYCIIDQGGNPPYRRTLSTPRVDTIPLGSGTNIVHVASFWMAGQMRDGPADIMYLSVGEDNDTLPATVLFAPADYIEYPPMDTLTFEETNGADRTVQGWRLPQDMLQWWTRTRARFSAPVDQPSFHFRFVSNDGNALAGSGVVIDDFWVRTALEPPPTITLGVEESR